MVEQMCMKMLMDRSLSIDRKFAITFTDKASHDDTVLLNFMLGIAVTCSTLWCDQFVRSETSQNLGSLLGRVSTTMDLTTQRR